MKKKVHLIIVSIIITLGCIIFMQPRVNAADSQGNLVIVLDPGHGGNDPGAINSSLGIREAEVNYKLAIYAKEELEKYEGVKVYLTRYANCPTIYERGEFAKNYNADLVVSLHINSGASSARGAEIWVTQDNTKVEYYQKSKEVGEKILEQISTLGIRNNGVSTRSGKADEWYESGVVKDYYGIIRYPMNYNIRSILVEHCYISNNSDCQYINEDYKIKNLALADVRGIVKAYALERKNEGKEPVKQLKLDKQDINLEIASYDPEPVTYIYPVFTPSNVYNTEVEYYSSNPEIVRVYNGKLRGLKEGETTITAISSNNQRIAKCKVIVTKPKVPLKDISVQQPKQIVYEDETGDVVIDFNPSDASDKLMYWESSDPETVRVYNGHFRGLKEGKATITGISRAGGKKVTCEVIVRNSNKKYVETINLPQKEYEVGVNEAVDIDFTYLPADASNAEFEWESSNPEILRVWGPRFRALKGGTAEIIGRTKDGTVEARATVTIHEYKVETIDLPKEEYEVEVNEAVDIDFTYSPTNASNAEFEWESSNPEILRVWGPRFRALKKGTAEIIGRTADGTVEARAKVVINNKKVENISTEKSIYTVNINEKGNIKINFNPVNATNQTLNWESSNPDIVRVYNGDFRGLKEGTSTITVVSEDGGKTASCNVIVKDPNKKYVETINLSKTEYTVKVNEAVDIDFTYSPTNACNAEFEWTSSNPEILRVWGPRFRALKTGMAEVIVRTVDGTVENRIKVNIVEE